MDETPKRSRIHTTFLSQAVERYAAVCQTCEDIFSESLLVHRKNYDERKIFSQENYDYRLLTNIKIF